MTPAEAAALVVLAMGFLVLLVAERGVHRPWMGVGKFVAGAGFTGLAVARGAPAEAYATLVLVALVLSWLADLFLVPAAQAAFRVAILLFLLAQLGYAAAFVAAGVRWAPVALVAVALALVGAAVGARIVPRADPALRGPVVAYIVAISGMVALGVGAAAASLWPGAALAALLFYVSDLTVALHRFVAPLYVYRAVGLPLYYAAQALFAWSVGI